MKKLKLDLESIAVESFEAQREPDARAAGTVRAHDADVRTLPISDCFWSACNTCGIYC
jgi:hypothetical protein